MGHNMSCGECENSRGSGTGMVYCLLYGIYIRSDYDGCKYHREGDLNENISCGYQPADQKA